MLDCILAARDSEKYTFKTKEGGIFIEVAASDVKTDFTGMPNISGENLRFLYGKNAKGKVPGYGCEIYGLSHKAYLGCPMMNVNYTYALLETMDELLFSHEFSSRFALVGTSNYRCFNDCIAVDCYTAVPCVYGYDEFKNSLVNFLKTLGVSAKVAVRKNDKAGTFAFMLKVLRVNKGLGLTEQTVSVCPSAWGKNMLRIGNNFYGGEKEIISSVALSKTIDGPVTRAPRDVGLQTRNYRLFPIDGKIYYLNQFTDKHTFGGAKALLENLHTLWKMVREIPIVDEMKIGGTSHGFSTIPYISGMGTFTIDVPIRTSLLPYTMEEIEEALSDELAEFPITTVIDEINWNVLRLKVTL